MISDWGVHCVEVFVFQSVIKGLVLLDQWEATTSMYKLCKIPWKITQGRGASGVYPRSTVCEAGTRLKWDASPLLGTKHTYIHTKGQFIIFNLQLFFLKWEETGKANENPNRCRENMQNSAQSENHTASPR